MSAGQLPVCHRELLGVLFARAGKLYIVSLLARVRQAIGLFVEDLKQFRVRVYRRQGIKVFRIAVELPVAAQKLEIAQLCTLP